MHKEYLPDINDRAKLMAHVVEEFAEVILTYGKIQRFGEYSYNPLVPPVEREYNIEAFFRELKDAKFAIERLESYNG